jgi:hypothetical protein
MTIPTMYAMNRPSPTAMMAQPKISRGFMFLSTHTGWVDAQARSIEDAARPS